MENKTAQDILYTAACCLWATLIAFLLGWVIRLCHLQTGFTYYCLNAFIDFVTIYAIVQVYVRYLTRPMAWVLLGAILANLWGWLDYRQHGYSEWFDTAMEGVAALQILVFIFADTRHRMGANPGRILGFIGSFIPRSHK